MEFIADEMQEPLHVMITDMWPFYCHSYLTLILLWCMVVGETTFTWIEPMCAAGLTWYTLKVFSLIIMKHAWWNWHAVPGTAYWNMGHTAGTSRKYAFWEILEIYVLWNISKIFHWIFFFCLTHGFNIELYDILYSILCKFCILGMGVLDWHIHCANVWNEIIKNA